MSGAGCYTEASWTGTFEDGYNGTPLSFANANGESICNVPLKRIRTNWTASTEAAGISFEVYGNAAGTDLLLEDTLVAGEVEANAQWVSDRAEDAVSADGYWFVMKCDTGAASATGTITFVFEHPPGFWRGNPVRTHTIDATGNPSDA